MSSPTLPAPREFVTQLLNSLPLLPQHNADTNPLHDAPEPVKRQLLSLQVLFPNEFLPALDLLDRRLVTRFCIDNSDPPPTGISSTASVPKADPNTAPPDPTPHLADTVHYVRSAQQRPSRFSTSFDTTASYEVRLSAWNCTCPAFAFAAFPSIHPEPPIPTYTSHYESALTRDLAGAEPDTERAAIEWVFGGMSLGEGIPPLCKHLLACVLAKRCKGVFGDCVEERMVGVETAAGWAAGWGDS